MADLELRKRIELALLEFAKKYVETDDMLGRLAVNEDVARYFIKEDRAHHITHAQLGRYNHFFNSAKRETTSYLNFKMEMYK